MKNLLFIITLFFVAQSCFAASQKMTAIKDMDNSFKAQHNICLNVANNFHTENQFSGYLKNKCTLYELDRARTLNMIFPMTSSNGEAYRANYRSMMAEYAAKMDKAHIANLKNVVTEYCKNNSYRYVKKDPKACERVNELFKQ